VDEYETVALADQYQDEIVTAAGKAQLRPFMFDGGRENDTREQQLRELEEIQEASKLCAQEYSTEAVWNEEVHRPILKLALKRYKDVVYRNVYGRRRILIYILCNG
jgi:hypothetical protein